MSDEHAHSILRLLRAATAPGASTGDLFRLADAMAQLGVGDADEGDDAPGGTSGASSHPSCRTSDDQ